MSDGISPELFPALAPPPPPDLKAAISDFDARLICDLVANIRAKDEVLAQYGLTVADLKTKAASPMWASAYREAERVWKSDMNIQQRIRLKAAFLLEDSLLPLFNIIRDAAMPVSAKLEAIEKLTKISTVANVPKELGTGERHNIVINIGGTKAPLVLQTVEKVLEHRENAG